jgi:HD-like signal output (HDOD) protein
LCAGLLHDLGSALAYRHDRALYAEVAAAPPDVLLAAERARYGADHAALAAIALKAWRLPTAIVEAVGYHHVPMTEIESTLLHAVVVGEALVRVAFGDATGFGVEPSGDPEATLALLALEPDELDGLKAQIAEEGEALGAVLVAA